MPQISERAALGTQRAPASHRQGPLSDQDHPHNVPPHPAPSSASGPPPPSPPSLSLSPPPPLPSLSPLRFTHSFATVYISNTHCVLYTPCGAGMAIDLGFPGSSGRCRQLGHAGACAACLQLGHLPPPALQLGATPSTQTPSAAFPPRHASVRRASASRSPDE